MHYRYIILKDLSVNNFGDSSYIGINDIINNLHEFHLAVECIIVFEVYTHNEFVLFVLIEIDDWNGEVLWQTFFNFGNRDAVHIKLDLIEDDTNAPRSNIAWEFMVLNDTNVFLIFGMCFCFKRTKYDLVWFNELLEFYEFNVTGNDGSTIKWTDFKRESNHGNAL